MLLFAGKCLIFTEFWLLSRLLRFTMERTFEFDGILSPSCIKHLVSIFLRHILYLRGQIPSHLDSIEALASLPDYKCPNMNGSCNMDVETTADAPNARETLRREREARKQRRFQTRLKQRAEKFLESFRQQDKLLSETLESVGLERDVHVAFVLGASVFSGRESYVLHLPAAGHFYDLHPRRVMPKRGVLQLFRNLVSWGALSSSAPISPTCLHVLVRADRRRVATGSSCPQLVARPQLSLRRGRLLRLRLLHASCELRPRAAAGSSVCCCVAASPDTSLTGSGCTEQMSPLLRIDGAAGSIGSCYYCRGRAMPTMSTGDMSPDSLWFRHRSTAQASDADSDMSDAVVRSSSCINRNTERHHEDCDSIWWQIPVSVRGFKDPAGGGASRLMV